MLTFSTGELGYRSRPLPLSSLTDDSGSRSTTLHQQITAKKQSARLPADERTSAWNSHGRRSFAAPWRLAEATGQPAATRWSTRPDRHGQDLGAAGVLLGDSNALKRLAGLPDEVQLATVDRADSAPQDSTTWVLATRACTDGSSALARGRGGRRH